MATWENSIEKRDWTLVEGLLEIFGTSRTAIASANKPHNKKPPAQAPSNLSPSLAWLRLVIGYLVNHGYSGLGLVMVRPLFGFG
jgi:hypothetical protein